MMKCSVCGAESNHAFDEKVLEKYNVSYYQCKNCFFLQAEKPYWLDEAYSSAISVSDTGLVMRNISLALKLASLLYFGFHSRSISATYLDVAGGYGMMARLMRDFGFDYYWDDKFCQNTMARGFEEDNAPSPFRGVSAFEVLEHIHDPLQFIDDIQKKHSSVTTFVFSTLLYEGDCLPDKSWWYYSFATGQHISFYHRKTMEYIAKKLGMQLISINGFHIFTKHRIRNRWLLPMVTGRLAPIFALWARYQLGSRTLKDSVSLLKKEKILL